ncbi:hypothetical protein TBLA_0C05510 [Henningerozyma blattae CBS 6284]|uniref:ORC6 first cyclin-like domain-containing protein n=1 Tax=Henningerozyma blattae (strain ATCC 34711 / CBS 6284 / DSM 70876 / NBRC 10599 / NRRL Y-10934 / UCD 77-7) TaxID=1071380 RepID=I2H1U7_HENB6|nr:hypothetical protein TBLA_0C05510 [Tetrapisispora blattae CBS 6284]CCH60349.1 hypothetical protein TBLA_0C05510 [Tetrapisispora blattae CBS 6284]
MSGKQMQQSVKDLLNISDLEDPPKEITPSILKKIIGATNRLYNSSINKVMLKNDEEPARSFICAYLSIERLDEKLKLNIPYYIDKIPLDPKKSKHLINLFKYQVIQSSPMKDFSWTPSSSPVKNLRKSPIKNSGSFTSRDPNELKKELFGDKNLKTPVKRTPFLSPSKYTTTPKLAGDDSNTQRKTRRKLAFEEENEDDVADIVNTISSPNKNKDTSLRRSPRKNLRNFKDTSDNTIHDEYDDLQSDYSNYKSSDDQSMAEEEEITDNVTDDELLKDLNSEESKVTDEVVDPPKRKRGRPRTRDLEGSSTKSNKIRKIPNNRSSRNEQSLLHRRYHKVTASELIALCNNFELPKETAYQLLDFYLENSTYLVCTWQLACGLVLNCTLIVFHDKFRKDPRIEHLIFQKMITLMRSNSINDVIECYTLVKELISGEEWYRDLQTKYNCFDGATYVEMISTKLGSMLQSDNILVTTEQYANWKHRILQDLSLRDPSFNA